MTNFGLERLLLVAPRCEMDDETWKMACHARHVLEAAETVDSLERVLPRFAYLAGTSGNVDLSSCAVPEEPGPVLGEILSAAGRGHLGLLFGPEDHGLGNQELKLCRWVVRIPTDHRNPSLNLSHAAAVLFAQLYRRCGLESRPPAPPRRDLAGVEELERLYRHLQEVLLDVGYLHENNPERIVYTFRRLLARAMPDRREVTILHGLLSQVDWALKQSGQTFRR